jgi:hypothetical protein
MKSLLKTSKHILPASLHILHQFHENVFGMLIKFVWVLRNAYRPQM